MKRYIYLEHTADAKFQAFGKSLEEAFSNAALAMLNLMCDIKNFRGKISKKISIKGKDKEALLYNFLEEILFLLDSKNFLTCKIKSIKIKEIKNGYKLEAGLLGNRASACKFFGEVKAVTYNNMFVKEAKKAKRFIIQAVVDL
jgi:SHS2 domain-containing protein